MEPAAVRSHVQCRRPLSLLRSLSKHTDHSGTQLTAVPRVNSRVKTNITSSTDFVVIVTSQGGGRKLHHYDARFTTPQTRNGRPDNWPSIL